MHDIVTRGTSPDASRCENRIGDPDMKISPLLFVAVGLSLAAAACDEPQYQPEPERVEVPEVTVEAIPAEDAAAPAAEAAPETTSTDASPLPTDARTSEETVRPESETMFY
jgi:hypothetical protein